MKLTRYDMSGSSSENCSEDASIDGRKHQIRHKITSIAELLEKSNLKLIKSALAAQEKEEAVRKIRQEMITISMSGEIFRTTVDNLFRAPDSVLGNASKRSRFWNEHEQAYIFERRSEYFLPIFNFYQTGLPIQRPMQVELDSFIDEIIYFGLDTILMPQSKSAKHDGFSLKDYVRKLMHDPHSSSVAKAFNYLSIGFTFVSIFAFCVETMKDHWLNFAALGPIDTLANVFFILEIVLRMGTTNPFRSFFRQAPNIIDLLSVLPFLLESVIFPLIFASNSIVNLSFLRLCRMLRVFRIAKLSRHNSNLRVMISTMRNSTGELCFMLTLMALSILVFSSACYLAEKQVLNTKFTSIPQSIWWSCITMTTVGYGDVVPATTAGKRIFAFALPVPGIIARFQVEQMKHAALNAIDISPTRKFLRKQFMDPMRSAQH